MKGRARALLLAVAAVTACGKGSSGGAGGDADAGLHGPTDLVAKWTFTGKAASAAACTAHGATKVYVTVSATLDPALHETKTVDCTVGAVDLGSMKVEDMGQPFLEASLLDDTGKSVATVGASFAPVLGKTTVTLDFFPATGAGGAGGTTSSSSSSSSSSTSSGGTGGAGGATSSSSGGTTSATGAGGGADAG